MQRQNRNSAHAGRSTTPPAASPTPPPTAVAADTPPTTIDRPDEAARKMPHANASTHVLKFDPTRFRSRTPPVCRQLQPPWRPQPAQFPPHLRPTHPPLNPSRKLRAEASDLLPPPAPNQNANVRRGPAASEDTRPLDTAQHLAMKVKTLELSDVPLGRFIDTISQMSGAAITLDPIVLELNGQSPRTPVSLKVADTTLDKALQDTLAAKRLELHRSGLAHHRWLSRCRRSPRGRLRRERSCRRRRRNTNCETHRAVCRPPFVENEWWRKAPSKFRAVRSYIDQTLAVRREVLDLLRTAAARSQPSVAKQVPRGPVDGCKPRQKTRQARLWPNIPRSLSCLGHASPMFLRSGSSSPGLRSLVDWSAAVGRKSTALVADRLFHDR